MLNTLNSAAPNNMMPTESGKRTEAASSAPEARGAVLQPVIDGWAVIRLEPRRGPSENVREATLTALIRVHGAGSSVVPMEELMRNLPLTIPPEQSEYVGGSGIGTSQLA